jgi:3-oxoacyl-[acyl-carrier-protein] synthase-1
MVAMDPKLPPDVAVGRRMIEMVTDAAAQAVAPLVASSSPPALDVVVALPAAGPGIGEQVAGGVMAALRDQLGGLSRGEAKAVVGGRSAGLLALESAIARLTSGKSRACLWCGVDSLLAPATLDAWDRDGALKYEATRWGIVPAEAAAACLLLSAPIAGITPLAMVAAVSVGADQRAAGEPRTGQALTSATRAVLGALPPNDRIDRVYADLNGDRGRVDDVGFTMARISARMASLPAITTPADRFGEVGAACAPLFVVLAVDAAQHGKASGPNVLIWTSGPGPHAGAALLSIPVRARER